MVLFPEMTDRFKKDDKFALGIKEAALETGGGDPCFPEFNSDSKNGNVNRRKERQRHEVTMNFHELQADDSKMGSKKRKLHCFLPSLNWIRNLAKDPLNPDTDPCPETSKWKSYDDDLPWKQILAAREFLMKKGVAPQPSASQKRQKMHPSMYDDTQSERVRSSRRILAHSLQSSSSSHDDESSDDKQGDVAEFWFLNHPRKRPRIGTLFQADLQPCVEKYAADPKWLGTRTWPLEKSENRALIERDPIGKGRTEHCGCEFPGNPDCVKFHIREKRVKAMLELRSAFYAWKLNSMGENVALLWTIEDQKKFQSTVETNLLSSDKYFWDELFKNFPGKGREALVSYYFNVFLLRRRSEQNRSSTSDIYSDDDDSESGPIANRFGRSAADFADSIFCSPKKSR